MPDIQHDEIELLLAKCQNHDKQARDQLFSLLYPELKRIANRKLYQKSHNLTAQTTEIVHELFLKLNNAGQFPAKSRLYFFSIAATMIEQIIMDYARRKNRQRRGGKLQKVELSDQHLIADDTVNEKLLELANAIQHLKDIDTTASSIVKLKLFAGLTNQEISETLDISERTVRRKWLLAKTHMNTLDEPDAENVTA